MQNSMVMFISFFFCFWPEILFWGKFGPKSQNYQLKLKFGTYTNSNMQNSIMLFPFLLFEWKYPFWGNMVQKNKIVTLSWNLVPTIIRTCRIQWWCSFFFCFWSEIPFWDKFGRKSQNYHLKLKFVTYTNSNMKNSMMLFSVFCFWVQIPFLGKFDPKSQNSHFKLKFGTTLIRTCRIQWWCSFILFLTENTLSGQICPKNQNYQLKLKFWYLD